jgi:ParB family chromosome partitioning protein
MSAQAIPKPFQIFDALPAHIEDALRASIERFGVLVPVAVDQHGTVIDGHHRRRIADELGVKYRVDTVVVASDDEAREISRHLNSRRRHLSGEQLKEHIVFLAQQANPSGEGALSQNEIARVSGVDQSYVNRVLREGMTSHTLPASRRGADGKVYPSRLTIVPAHDEEEAARVQEVLARDRVPRVARSTGYPCHFTPREVIDMAVAVMGGIDLDPASCAEANETVGATMFYTEVEDGLSQPWRGRVFLNPPYSPTMFPFCEAAASKFESGEISEAIVLTHNSTETRWFRRLVKVSAAICFVNRRIQFIRQETQSDYSGPTQAQALFYLGGNTEKFTAVFENLGWIAIPLNMKDSRVKA